MPSERRLHPASFFFMVAGHARELILPAVALVFTAGTTGRGWQPWMMVLFLPFAVSSLVRVLSYRYRFDETELVVRTGFVFRNERHIPYARIQNIDAIQNVLHRLLGVVEVRVETGAGGEPDATMRVLPASAFHEMRAHVFRTRARDPAIAQAQTPAGDTLLALSPGELLLSGFIDNRGVIVIAAAFGLLWEMGLADRLLETFVGADPEAGAPAMADRYARRVQFTRWLIGEGVPPIRRIAVMLGALAALLLAVRVLSMAWVLVRLQGFVLRRAGEDLRTQFGLLTRVAATIPLRRIQTLTIFEGPLHQLFGRASIKVDTAGGEGAQPGAARREPLAPIIGREAVPRLLEQVLPEVDLARVEWRPPAPRAFRRVLVRGAATAIVLSSASIPLLGSWALALFATLLALALLHARFYVSHLGWATLEGAVLCRRGWLWRRLSIARFSKMQVLVLLESPFDRRTDMARLVVDTAGAGSGHGVEIPYMPRGAALALHRDLSIEAAQTAFRW